MKRIDFHRSVAWKWVCENHPEIANAIREEALRIWPSPTKDKVRSKLFIDFLDSLKKSK